MSYLAFIYYYQIVFMSKLSTFWKEYLPDCTVRASHPDPGENNTGSVLILHAQILRAERPD